MCFSYTCYFLTNYYAIIYEQEIKFQSKTECNNRSASLQPLQNLFPSMVLIGQQIMGTECIAFDVTPNNLMSHLWCHTKSFQDSPVSVTYSHHSTWHTLKEWPPVVVPTTSKGRPSVFSCDAIALPAPR